MVTFLKYNEGRAVQKYNNGRAVQEIDNIFIEWYTNMKKYMYICIYTYIYLHIYIYIYTYIIIKGGQPGLRALVTEGGGASWKPLATGKS